MSPVSLLRNARRHAAACVLAVSGLVTFSAGTQGADAPPQPVQSASLSELIQFALQRNLDIQFDRYAPELAYNDLAIAQAGFEPNFNFGYTRSFSRAGGQAFNPNTQLPGFGSETTSDTLTGGINGNVPFYGMQYRITMDAREDGGLRDSAGGVTPFSNANGNLRASVTQPLLRNLWIDTPRLNIAVARNRIKFSELGLKEQIITTVTDVENAYYDLVFNRESVKVQEKALELAERLLAENKKRVEVGALAPLDEKQAESQVAARRADLLNAQRAYAAAQNALRRIITDDYASIATTIIEPADPLTPVVQFFDVQESWRKGMELRPDLQQAKLDLERQGIQLRFQKNQVYPQLDVVGSYGHNASGGTVLSMSDVFQQFGNGDLPTWSVGAVFSIPLGNTAARTRVKSTQISVQQALVLVKALEQDIMVQIDDAIQLAKKEFLRIDSTRQARLYAEAALEAEQKKLENGKSTSFVVLQLQRDFINARSEEIRALADYNKALARLAQQEGSTLDRRNIQLRFD
jgi:outer membrane protein TolC